MLSAHVLSTLLFHTRHHIFPVLFAKTCTISHHWRQNSKSIPNTRRKHRMRQNTQERFSFSKAFIFIPLVILFEPKPRVHHLHIKKQMFSLIYAEKVTLKSNCELNKKSAVFTQKHCSTKQLATDTVNLPKAISKSCQ